MKVIAVTLSNDEWPEDRTEAIILVAAENNEQAVELVRADTQWKDLHALEDVFSVPDVYTNLDTPQIITQV
jgi:hypothetical protein